MSSAISARECPICLGTLRNPVVTPCGHLTCEVCINAHVRRSSHPYEAKCPSCHAPFPTVIADLSTIPRKYHVFISPPLRRLYLGDLDGNNRAVTHGLRLEITTLRERIATLNRDNESLSKNLLESRSTISRLASAQRAARLSLDELKKGVRLLLDMSKEAYNALDKAREDRRVTQDKDKEEAHLADQGSEGLRVGYDTLKPRGMNSSLVINTNCTSGQAALENPSSNGIASSPQRVDLLFKDRPIRPLHKHVNPASRTSLLYDGRRDVNDHAGYRFCYLVLAFVLGLVWYTTAKWANETNRGQHSRWW